MSKQLWRYETLYQNTEKIKRYCKMFDLELEVLNNGYQLRVENMVDFYPVRAKYNNLTTSERGEWRNATDFKQIMLKAIPRGDTRVGNMYETKPQPQTLNVLSVPAPKRLYPRLILAKIRRLFK